MKALPKEAWKSYIPDDDTRFVDSLSVKHVPAKKALPPAAQKDANHAKDLVMLSLNETIIQKSASGALSKLHERQKNERAETTKDKKTKKDKRPIKQETAIFEEEEEEKVIEMKRVKVEPKLIVRMEDQPPNDQNLHLFAVSMAKLDTRPTTEMIIKMPPASKVLAFAAQHKDRNPWYKAMVDFVVENDYNFPDVSVLSRRYLVHFLREANPNIKYERACFNGERCIAFDMSLRSLGKGFKLRELLLSDVSLEINIAIEQRKDPTLCLPKVAGLCYFCHMRLVLDDCNHQRSKATLEVVIINRFMVVVDEYGEYDREAMLTADKVALGIWGPFPLFNEINYLAKAGHFVEKDELLFRLTPESPLLIESSQTSTSTRSTRVYAPQASGVLSH